MGQPGDGWGLNVTYLWEGNSARTPAGMPGLTSRLAEQLNGLTEEDFPLLENYAYNIFDQGGRPSACKWGGRPESGSFCTAATAGIR